jgi:hypothetical protein
MIQLGAVKKFAERVLAAENKILRAHFPVQLRLTDPNAPRFPKLANDSAVKPCSSGACVIEPDTILAGIEN